MPDMGLGDLASQVAEDLQRQHTQETKESPRQAIEEESPMVIENRSGGPFAKIRFSWRSSDKAILEQIKTAAQTVFWEQFSDTVAALDKFYSSVRVPETRSVGGETIVVKDAGGRLVFRRDDAGQFVEDWSQLTGYDIDELLFRLQRVKLALSQQTTELLNEAVFARYIAQDAYDEAYGSLMEGTQGDRSARANRESRQDRYQAFFRYWLWSQADVFMKELTQFLRVAERIRGFRIQDLRD